MVLLLYETLTEVIQWYSVSYSASLGVKIVLLKFLVP